MQRLLNERELGELLDQAQHDLFRLETLDAYEVASDGSDFARYLAGEPGPDPARKGPWLARLREDAERGLHNRRVHVVRSPLTPYERYECEWGYAPNSDAGEDIRILDLAETDAPAGLVDHDFWLMDDRVVAVMRYDRAGRFLGASAAEPERLDLYRRAAGAAWRAAKPFSAYWAAHPQYQRDHPAVGE